MVTQNVLSGVTSEDVVTALECLHIMISKRRKQVNSSTGLDASGHVLLMSSELIYIYIYILYIIM